MSVQKIDLSLSMTAVVFALLVPLLALSGANHSLLLAGLLFVFSGVAALISLLKNRESSLSANLALAAGMLLSVYAATVFVSFFFLLLF